MTSIPVLLRAYFIFLSLYMLPGCLLDVEEDSEIADEEKVKEFATHLQPLVFDEPRDPNTCGHRIGDALFGIDTNQISGVPGQDNQNLDIAFAVSQGVKWVGRYIVANGCEPHRMAVCPPPPGSKVSLPVSLPVTQDEVRRWHKQGVSMAFIWQLHDTHRACSARNLKQQRQHGHQDAVEARHYMNNVLGAPRDTVIYFVADFNVTNQQWVSDKTVSGCHKDVPTKEMILAYFEGIGNVLEQGRIGVYGSFGTVHGLLNAKSVRHAWQQTFHCKERTDRGRPPIDQRAGLQQFNILPKQENWLAQSAAGGLDFNNATHGLVGMWRPSNNLEFEIKPVSTQAYLTFDGHQNGTPGTASVSGNIFRGDGRTAAEGTVNVNFQKLVNGTWSTMSTAQRTLVNGHYEVLRWGVGRGQWRVRAVFPKQGDYSTSESNYHEFEIKPLPTDTFLTLNGFRNGTPGTASVSGNVFRGGRSAAATGTVNVNFQKLVGGTWTTMSTAQRTLVNGHYDVLNWGVGVGRWRVRAVFPDQGDYSYSESHYHEFSIQR